jgi:site-specific DNA-cytosine methylase
MNVLIACEYSGIVREAFMWRGHNAWSCDILSTSISGSHIQNDIKNVLRYQWDLMIAHPPCTYLTVSGNKWFYHPDDVNLPIDKRRSHPRFPERQKQRKIAIDFFMMLANVNIEKIAIENPVGIMSTMWRKPDQYIQPYWFGDPHSKKTGLWLKNLPLLKPTQIVKPEWYICKKKKRHSLWHFKTLNLPIHERAKIRSKTFNGIAQAMADQWGV